MKAHRLDVRADHGPPARPVLAYCFAPMNVATIHTVGPDDIIGEHGQHAVNVPRVKAIVDALKEFDISIHRFSPMSLCHGRAWRRRKARETALLAFGASVKPSACDTRLSKRTDTCQACPG